MNTTPDSGLPSGVVFAYDVYNNQVAKYEYDYGAAPGIGAACPSTTDFTRQTLTAFNTGSAYLAPGVHLLDLPISIVVTDVNGGVYAKRLLSYDEQAVQAEPGITGIDGSTPAARGNVTTDQQWWNTNNTYPAHHYTYDVAGNVLTDTDPKGNQTSFGCADSNNTYAHAT